MSQYDKEYFFILKPAERADLPSLTPDEGTAVREFRSKPQPFGSAPLVFFNGAGDYQKKLGIQVVQSPPKILFDGPNLVIDHAIRETIFNLGIPHLHLHPAVYIHDNGRRYDTYWYLTFAQEFDCWDRETSTYHPEPMMFGDMESYEVFDYHLRDDVIDATPLADRLLFQMGGTSAGNITCHESIIRLFGLDEASGASSVRVDKYVEI